MGQTRVDLQHLLEDLRDAYPGSLEETILTEMVANALDSGARTISLLTDPAEGLLVVVDDGSGMSRRELARYHDIAASSKARGEGIGFAGVGIKLGLLVSAEVLTESRRQTSHVATRWRLASRHKAPWRWVDPRGFLQGQGTAVCLRLHNALSPLLDAGFIEAALRRHFQPLIETAFDEILSTAYPEGVTLRIGGRVLPRQSAPVDAAPLLIRLPRRRRPAAIGYLARSPETVEEDRRGIAVSTLGKVIRRGWDWLAMTPGAQDRVTGVIEAPGLAEALTLNKADFLRSGPRGLIYLTYRKAIQEAVAAQLEAWGDRPESETSDRRIARPVERDLETVLVDLAEEFPALAALVERRPGGQRRLPSGVAAGVSAGTTALALEDSAGAQRSAGSGGSPAPEVDEGEEAPPADVHEAPDATVLTPFLGGRGPRRPARYGLTIRFEERPDSIELGRLVESAVWVNTAHPAYLRAVASRAEGYHLALTVAMALAPLAAEPSGAQEFLTTFLARWGEALGRDGRRRGARRPLRSVAGQRGRPKTAGKR